MVLSLCLLAAAIGALVYSSWSQMSGDRALAMEIGQLADEINHAHELKRWGEGLERSYLKLDSLDKEQQKSKTDPIVFEFPDARGKAIEDVNFYFERLEFTLNNYQAWIATQSKSDVERSLLIDRTQQDVNLKSIKSLLDRTREDWDKWMNVEHGSIFMTFYSADLSERIPDLSAQINGPFESIKVAMKGFRNKVDSEHQSKRSTFWALTCISFFFMLCLAWVFWTSIVVPFRTLIKGSELIAAGHHKHKILLGTNDEIGLMAETINQITDGFNEAVENTTLAWKRAQQEVRERTREVIQNEQLASVGFLAAGVAHEINNPLGAIAWSAEALEESIDDLPEDELAQIDQDFVAELKTNLGLIQSEAFRCKGITKRLLSFSKLSDSMRAPEDLGELVRRVVGLVAKVGEYRCKTIKTHLGDEVLAYCNAQEIQQVVLNLVSNALESVDTEGKVDVFVRQEFDPLSGRTNAVVSVEDDGCGMTQEVMDHLFEPFFTRRRDNSGTGLGLSISARIVSLHHGSLTPHSEGEGCGSKMVLRLPAEAPKEVAAPTLRMPAISSPIDAAPQIDVDSEQNIEDVEKVA
ncbi:HAMP domain-containing protein [Stieleria sp. JC731]|uniref:sensor histidine kinase n=1 Tax=Pirellulaceae TaxID=2691357 RepID=UPI001E4E8407|nr:sensor histidine kinase [Stieleria sp. JC731]MCC9601731.1 HAMP domain-containing protein [Stieleria sp. JC731]